MPRLIFLLVFCVACDSTLPPDPARDGGVDGEVITDDRDTDMDGLSDREEGRGLGTDTDGDGIPDFRDDDSDGDGIADSVEAGDTDLATPARDSDGDGTPDFRDLDSDDNGIPDSDESTADTDGDGRPDYADEDDDSDRVPDRVELMHGGAGIDTDGDGIVDFKDPDSDDDTILDGDERDIDTDGDGLEDWADLDSDSDGISDADEAGDTDLFTRPVDTDSDGTPDFRDPDSDNDGVSDLDEVARGTSPTDTDSDMDGVSDLIEIGAGTDPLDAGDSPRTRGDFVFVVPWMAPSDPPEDTLEFRTNIQIADVYFLFDTTGSMRGEIAEMRSAVVGIIEDLTCADRGRSCTSDDECDGGDICSIEGRCIEDPTASSCVASVFTGVGTYEGNPHSYRNLLSLQPDAATTRRRIPMSASGGGANEALFQSVACVADPTACNHGGTCGAGGIGCPAYRSEAVRILVTITDEQDECACGAVDSALAAGSRLMTSGITFVGVDADVRHEPRTDLRAIATRSGSLDGAGMPFVREGDGAAVRSAVVDAINEIVNGVPLRVTIEATEEAGDDGDALRFIDHLVVNTSGMPAACSAASPTEDTNADGHDDAFPALLPGTSVCWDVVPIAVNEIQEPSASPLVYKARLTVKGDGSPLDDRVVFFLVPPRIEVPMAPD